VVLGEKQIAGTFTTPISKFPEIAEAFLSHTLDHFSAFNLLDYQ